MELKPCPFCGGEAIISEICFLHKTFRVYCEECPVSIELSFSDAGIGLGEFISFYEAKKIMKELEEAWNRRLGEGEKE